MGRQNARGESLKDLPLDPDDVLAMDCVNSRLGC